MSCTRAISFMNKLQISSLPEWHEEENISQACLLSVKNSEEKKNKTKQKCALGFLSSKLVQNNIPTTFPVCNKFAIHSRSTVH